MAKRRHLLSHQRARCISHGLLLCVALSLPLTAPAQLLPAFSAPQTTTGTAASAVALQEQPAEDSHNNNDKNRPPAVQPIPNPQLPPQGVQPRPDGVMPGVRRGSIQDVNAVGDRKIGGRGLGNWYGERAEIEMGQQYAAEIDKSTHFIKDPVVDEYINRIGQNLVKNSDAKVPFTIKVIDSNQINAFALPGGFFYVNSGLILAADNEAELAAVMAHEIAHVAAHHAAREMTRMHYAQIGSVPLIFMGGWAGYGIYEAANLAIPITFLQFSREFEAQADYLGVQYLYRTGYDPTAMISFFEKIEALEKQKPGIIARAFDTHPQTPDRIEATEQEIAHILPPRREYLEDTSEFEQVKARLARIENRRKLHAPPKSQRPSLRRASTNNPGSEEPPTLHRQQIDGTSN
ncbi:peptidase, M48 family [Acidobacterium capsulatum ATCC 51196]|uniref:Peptidase, M48 family n=2 Tax=Acidobacteriaceae TaxID=204434 RepID=C1F1G9_ACIC5|nr:peptidase, M48 family [Acidobacterium capsulatum ATCC 51196]